MKRVLSALSLFLLFSQQIGGCASPYPIAKVTLHVVNQDGEPVSDAKISAGFWMGNENLSAYPNKDGFVSFRSPVIGDAVFSNELLYHPARNPDAKDKYYLTIFRLHYGSPSKDTRDGKWQPWNPTIEMVLKERINPIPMYANERQRNEPIPERNQWCGFDMTKNAWVSPYGIGEHADVEICHEWDGKEGKEYTGSTLKLRFPDKGAGCYAVRHNYEKMYDSIVFKSPYHAVPSKIALKELKFYEKYNPETKRFNRHLFPDGTVYIFRTRTRFDGNGRLVGAHYGKIYQPYALIFGFWRGGSYIRLPFYLNPTENDTNLEFDPERNLIKNVRGYVDP